MKRNEHNGLVWYESESLAEIGVRHGFFTRSGGVSQAPFDSLNVKYDIDDSSDSVTENRNRILNTLQTKVFYFAKLIHGDSWYQVDGEDEGAKDIPDVDGLITQQKNIALGLSVADCLPIIISDGKILAVVHAGWRGTVQLITKKVCEELIAQGLDLQRAIAATGPCICKGHFEVRDEAAEKLRELAGEDPIPFPYHADLEALNVDQLHQCGITNVDTLSICSFESNEFFSHRRDHGKTGRNMAIALLS